MLGPVSRFLSKLRSGADLGADLGDEGSRRRRWCPVRVSCSSVRLSPTGSLSGLALVIGLGLVLHVARLLSSDRSERRPCEPKGGRQMALRPTRMVVVTVATLWVGGTADFQAPQG